ncbi:MAG: thioredoxin family protein [Proteobacteria bacterium]|nr:thioredoxin family protein [Pseudomonadota bacterium]
MPKARGETDATRKLLLQAITLDPRHEAARLDLVDLMIDAKDIEEARRLLDEIADRARDAVRVDALRARLQLVANSGSGADRASLERKIAADPADLEAHFELANLTLINLFNLLGSDNALVREYRSRLAAALN